MRNWKMARIFLRKLKLMARADDELGYELLQTQHALLLCDYAACHCRMYGLHMEGVFVMDSSSEDNPLTLKASILKTASSLELYSSI